jgi:flagellar biosynthetic protein FliS
METFLSNYYMSPLEKYKATAATTSSNNNQLIFIFDEVLKLLLSAQKAIEEKKYETKFKALTRVIETLYILKAGIDSESKDEQIKAIDIFYGSTIYQLEDINIKGDKPEALQPIIKAISEVRAALAGA